MCTAYHEAGHTLVAYFTKDATPLHKVTIVPRGTSLGHVSHAGHLCAVDYVTICSTKQRYLLFKWTDILVSRNMT